MILQDDDYDDNVDLDGVDYKFFWPKVWRR